MNSPTKPPINQLLALALLSGGSLVLEISLTRLFSTLFYPPYVFAIISLAVLGLGMGAAMASWRPEQRMAHNLSRYVTLASLTSLLLLLVVVWTAPLDLGGMLLAMVPMPYVFVGQALVTFFSRTPELSPALYRADLAGAGLGAVAALPLLNWLGGLNGTLAAAGLLGLAGLVATAISPGRRPVEPLLLTGLILTGLAANLGLPAPWLRIDLARLSPAKPVTESLQGGGRLLASRWDAFARTDLVDPGQGRPYELYLDGAAGSVMPPAGDLTLLRSDIGFFPFATAQPERVMVIGPGGGLDVWFALSGRARQITAVEVNPASVALVNRFAAYHDDLYHQPGVRVVVDEGRSLLRREAVQYDLIYLSQVVTLAAERDGYALTENTIYTVEAFQDYLAHLRPGGQIAMKLYDELTLTRALITAATALQERQSLTDVEALARVAAFLDQEAEPPIPLLLVQAEPFRREEALGYAGVAAEVGFVPLFVPGVAGGGPLTKVLAGEQSLTDLVAASESDVSPPTDNRPFFYEFEPGLPASLRPLLLGLGGLVAVGGVGLILAQRRFDSRLARYSPLYFAALGFGFMAIEIALIQQTRLFLGHPSLAITTVLAVLLVGGGVGSGLAGHWFDGRSSRSLTWPAAGIALLVLIWLPLWPWLADTFGSSQTPTRLVVAGLSLLSLALLLGMPFPLGLRAVGALPEGDRHVALGWAVNGVMTVVGSAGAVAGAMIGGFSGVLLGGALLYLLAAGLGYWVGE